MRITFITASPEMKEFSRIREECLDLGYKYNLVNFKDFKYLKKGSEFSIFPKIPRSDIVVLRALFPTMASMEPLADYLRSKKTKVFDNNLLTHRYSMNKSYDIFKLILAGVDVPDTFSSRKYSDLLGFSVSDTLGYPLVVKSSRSGQGGGVWMVHNNSEYKDFIKKFEQQNYPAKNIIAQSFVDYEYDLRILVIGKSMFCMRRIPKKDDFRANFSLGGSVELFPLNHELRELSRKAVAAVGLKVAGVDVLIDKNDKKYILEVNHTPGMLGMEQATKQNITKIYLDYIVSQAYTIK